MSLGHVRMAPILPNLHKCCQDEFSEIISSQEQTDRLQRGRQTEKKEGGWQGGRKRLTLVSAQIALKLYFLWMESTTTQYLRNHALKSENLGLNPDCVTYTGVAWGSSYFPSLRLSFLIEKWGNSPSIKWLLWTLIEVIRTKLLEHSQTWDFSKQILEP